MTGCVWRFCQIVYQATKPTYVQTCYLLMLSCMLCLLLLWMSTLFQGPLWQRAPRSNTSGCCKKVLPENQNAPTFPDYNYLFCLFWGIFQINHKKLSVLYFGYNIIIYIQLVFLFSNVFLKSLVVFMNFWLIPRTKLFR